jgi:hypothetical protein
MADEPVRKVEEERREEHEPRGERRSRRGQQRETIVVDLGRKSRKDVRDLRKGRGPLMEDVEDCIDELRESGDIAESAQPVVIIVERRWSGRGGMVPFLLPPGIPAMLPLGMEREDDEDDDEDEDDED